MKKKSRDLRKARRIARNNSSSVCKGHCCASFTLPSPEKLVQKFNNPNSELSNLDRDTFIYLRETEGVEEGDPNNHEYTCKYFVNGRCSIYKDRPKMCSEFPYNYICGICGLIGPQVKDPSKAQVMYCCGYHKKQYEKYGAGA